MSLSSQLSCPSLSGCRRNCVRTVSECVCVCVLPGNTHSHNWIPSDLLTGTSAHTHAGIFSNGKMITQVAFISYVGNVCLCTSCADRGYKNQHLITWNAQNPQEFPKHQIWCHCFFFSFSPLPSSLRSYSGIRVGRRVQFKLAHARTFG